jgi:RNA polymerase sigma-70 factor (ECF subfamily)
VLRTFCRQVTGADDVDGNRTGSPRVQYYSVSFGLFGPAKDRVREFEDAALVHLDSLYRAALRLTGQRADADDIVQETFLRAFKSFHRFNPGTNCRAWLFTIMRNAFLNRVRAAGREVLEDDMDRHELERTLLAGLEVPGPEEAFFQTVLHGDVDRALKKLPLAFREAVILADLEGLSYREIAEVLGCPVGTVMSRLSRGRRLLRAALARFAREHGYLKGADDV